MDLKQSLGFVSEHEAGERNRLLRYINLQLIANGWPGVLEEDEAEFVQIARGLLDRHREQARQLQGERCPADARIEAFLQSHFADQNLNFELRLPGRTFVLDRHGIARELSLPVDSNTFSNELLTSFRVKNGILHNPASDRRTTTGTFHVCEGGLPISGDKYAVPKRAFAELFRAPPLASG